jgi:hypothetical protein
MGREKRRKGNREEERRRKAGPGRPKGRRRM